MYQLLDVCKLVFCFEFSDIREKLWRRRRWKKLANAKRFVFWANAKIVKWRKFIGISRRVAFSPSLKHEHQQMKNWLTAVAVICTHIAHSLALFPVDTGRKLNVHKTFRRRPGRLLNVLCTFNVRPVSTGLLQLVAVFMDKKFRGGLEPSHMNRQNFTKTLNFTNKD